MKKEMSKNQSVDLMLSEEQKKALKIDLSSLSKRMTARLQKLRGEETSDLTLKQAYQQEHQPA